ncbi:hypothetical protein T4D_7097 [Trichinella pseudospiralis]|uniref:Uncharacterized protein n=1 Tax=Trichinella pseudospiralis TaxID=6337 RepID=A0A0V1DM39_TRIPS|nr:hypothetical protein T4D_7097 [Trichinella pseudospiralis]
MSTPVPFTYPITFWDINGRNACWGFNFCISCLSHQILGRKCTNRNAGL